ncbi:hypothetical protein OIU79_008729 [Salix purpurea]|uniref:Uncharacterized protein n=1 Tax=Salix purpurea TaxID=77065 RepID=A0A9Q0TJ01_SALPP|nr:hypothetical protein OIU79_008729 [Salix purpurea]
MKQCMEIITSIYLYKMFYSYSEKHNPSFHTCDTFLPTVIEFDVNSEPEINFAFKCVGGYSSNSPVHKKIPGASNHGYISGLYHNGVSSQEIYGAKVVCGIKGKRKP